VESEQKIGSLNAKESSAKGEKYYVMEKELYSEMDRHLGSIDLDTLECL